MKVKNIKTIVKANEVIIDKKKIFMEYQALRNKIKMLEKLINDKKSLKEKNNEGNKGNKTSSKLGFWMSPIPNNFNNFSKLNFI